MLTMTWEELLAAMPRMEPRDVLDLGSDQWDLTWADLERNGPPKEPRRREGGRDV
jgi:hypothetical protein